MRRSLVLNASYEPLGVVPWQRAVWMVLDEQADLLEAGDGMVRSPSTSLSVPSVIRLRRMVSAPRRRSVPVSRRAVFARDEYRCQYCDERADSIDHVLPRSRGGADVWDNLVAACRPCNTRKRDRTPDEAGMRLLRPCRAPTDAASFVLGPIGVPDHWKPYLPLAS
jgi:5-methylcytosine-specific restriction endonuclease McrA